MAEESKDFDKLLLDSIDEALLSLGESAKQSVYFHLENSFKLTRRDIPQKLPDFQTAMEKLFGIGSRFIEILVMKNLYSKIGHPLNIKNNEQLEFIKYVKAAKRSFIQKRCT
jgi:hypothetical protein